MNWFTADLHLSHFAIIEFCHRPFWSWIEMNKVILERFNSRVARDDTTYILGDFKLTTVGHSFNEFVEAMNGRKVFIKGNHDERNGNKTVLKYGVIETFGKTILLAHDPKDAEMYMQIGGIDMAFVGHVHTAWKFKDNMVNVGVDVWDFYPVHVKQILKGYRDWRMGR